VNCRAAGKCSGPLLGAVYRGVEKSANRGLTAAAISRDPSKQQRGQTALAVWTFALSRLISASRRAACMGSVLTERLFALLRWYA
jgi:hypothetical protein